MSELNTTEHAMPVGPLKLAVLEGCKEFGGKVDKYLVDFRHNSPMRSNTSFTLPGYCEDSYLLNCSCPRFGTGEGKGQIMESVRGCDLFILVDVCNYSLTYSVCGHLNHMSPDNHFQDLKRIISAANGKAKRITVIMPMLYGGRQHRRSARESLDCAQMLLELQNMGVADIITFDAHDPRVQNAVPLMGFDNYFAHYQILKCLTRRFPDVKLKKDSLMVISPDEGAMTRNVFYASVLGLDLGMFYKRRDYSTIINGRNPIVAHEYIGASVEGMNVFVADDMIATGDSILKLAKEIKEKGAKKVFLAATFSLFTEGVDKFNKAYQDGVFDAVLSTNLTYRIPELKECEWFVEADLSKYISYIIAAANVNESVANLLDPSQKIRELVDRLNG